MYFMVFFWMEFFWLFQSLNHFLAGSFYKNRWQTGSDLQVCLLASCSVVSDSLLPLGLCSPWNSPDQNIGMSSCSLLQGIFPTQQLNPGLPHCRWILCQLSHQGSPRILEWVVYPFSSGSSPALQVDSLPDELPSVFVDTKLWISCSFNVLHVLLLNGKFLNFSLTQSLF